MTRESIEERMKELKQAAEQSAMNHHALMGRLAEVTHILETFFLKDKMDETPS